MLWPPHWSASARSSVSNDSIPDKVTFRPTAGLLAIAGKQADEDATNIRTQARQRRARGQARERSGDERLTRYGPRHSGNVIRRTRSPGYVWRVAPESRLARTHATSERRL